MDRGRLHAGRRGDVGSRPRRGARPRAHVGAHPVDQRSRRHLAVHQQPLLCATPPRQADPTLELDPRLAFGVELALTIADSKGYQLYGGYLLGQATLYQGDLFGLMLTWGAGLGTGPAILASDLLAESDYTLWVLVGVDMRWTVVCDWLDVMVALRSEHITVITATAGLVFRL